MNKDASDRAFVFVRVSRWLIHAEGVIYFAVGMVLVVAAGALLMSAGAAFIRGVGLDMRPVVLQMLDSLLLVLMLVEILHTVGISLRSHELIPEPFLIVGLISAIRRVLVITAEQQPGSTAPAQFQMTLLELGLLTFTIMALVLAIYLLRAQAASASARRSGSVELSDGTLRSGRVTPDGIVNERGHVP